MDYLINLNTNKLIKSYVDNPSSTLLLVGSDEDNIEEISDDTAKKINQTKVVIKVEPVKNIITITQIRELKAGLTTKNTLLQSVIIYQAEKLTTEAQNALLKLIEEPNVNLAIILTANNINNLLPTLLSRCFKIKILPLTNNHLNQIFKANNIPENEHNRVKLLTQGRSKLVEKYLSGEFENIIFEEAKQFLGLKKVDKLAKFEEYSDSTKFNELIEKLIQISEATLHHSKDVNKWREINKILLNTRERLNSNVNIKLLYLNMCLSL